MSLDRSNIHLLLVEDEREYLEELIEWLNDEFGYQHIEIARTVDEAKVKLDEKPFDVIITDMWFGGHTTGGFDVLSEKRTDRNITSVIIVLTANDSAIDCRRAFKEDAWDYIPKAIRNENAFELLDESIYEAITFFNERGADKDQAWIKENMEQLLEEYSDQYVAVINNRVIANADTKEGLKKELREKRYPLYMPVIEKIEQIVLSFEEPLSKKLTVFVEGPTDVKYIKKAATILAKEDLLKGVYLDTIGDRTGQTGNGWKPMGQGFNFLKNNPKYRGNKVLFLCDQDVRDRELPNRGSDFENLFVRRIGDYSSENKGIEWLFPDSVFEDGFCEGFVSKNLGTASRDNPTPQSTYVIKNTKMQLCDWICNERENEAEEFEGFRKIFEIIDEILSAQNGSLSVSAQ